MSFNIKNILKKEPVLIVSVLLAAVSAVFVHPDLQYLSYIDYRTLSILVVARLIDFRIGLLIIVALVIMFDRKTVLRADYSLLLTFIFLFIFIGNMKRIPAISSALSAVVSGHEVAAGVILSQCISNVPAAILCSGFTTNIPSLIIGVNFGGLGTLIASMASLISFKQYTALEHAETGKYIKSFSIRNIIFLILMIGFYAAVNLFL